MSCNSDKNLQAAVVLGLLWGMNRVSMKQGSLEDFENKAKALLEYIGVNLPITMQPPDGLTVGDETMYHLPSGAWRIGEGDQGSIYLHFGQALHEVLVAKMERVAKQFADAHPDMDAADKDTLKALAEDFSEQLSDDNGLLRGHTVKMSMTIPYGHTGVEAHLFVMDGQKDGVIDGIGSSSHHPPAETMQNVMAHLADDMLLKARHRLEPAVGIWTDDAAANYLNNGFFSTQYIDQHTAKSLGEDVERGWYVVRDNLPLKGPFPTPSRAADWVKHEWGMEVEMYAQVARLNDQYQTLRIQYDREIRKLEKAKLSAKKRKDARAQLDEQFEYSVRALVEPFILADQDVTTGNDKKRRFTIRGKDDTRYIVTITQTNSGTPHTKWEMSQEIAPGKLAWKGKGFGTMPDESAERHEGVHDMLLFVVKSMIVQGLVARP